MTKKFLSHKRFLSPSEILTQRLHELLSASGNDIPFPGDVPSKWEKHGDLILLPAWSFRSEIWSSYGNKVWDVVASSLKCNRVARKHAIHNDNYRSPQVELLKGSNSWVVHIDNKIKYTYDITKCMFSAGNITEKLRIAQLPCEGETVVDLYSGIGYFTLPFLVHAKAAEVHACEWNPHAVEALSKNLTLNGVKNKCIIYYGDNREVCPKKVADRVNLGLIPSSESGWETACKALKPSGGTLHIHGNVTSNLLSFRTVEHLPNPPSIKPEWIAWSKSVSQSIASILFQLYKNRWTVKIDKIIKIKSYAPHIDHLVIDLICRPNEDFVYS